MPKSPFAPSSPKDAPAPPQSTNSNLTVPPIGVRPGRLVIVGSGIKSIGQFTLEAIAEIKQADKVFFGVADPATEAFILENNPKAIDLYSLYDDGKHRSETYVQMAEVLLREVRKGYFVVGVFYGHPGVFVNPSHRAIAIARSEGFSAVMYAGVSAEDCLFSEIGVDPSRPGCQTVEATDLLLRNRPLLTDSHVIIFQVGCVGLMDFNFKGFKNIHFPVLVDRLINDYGENHTVISFRDSQTRFVPSDTRRFPLGDLRKPEVQKTITGLTTFYLPPKELRETDAAMAERLGLRVVPANSKLFSGPFPTDYPYTPRAIAAVEALDTHKLPENYRKLRATREMYDAMKRLALDPRARALYARDKSSFIAPYLQLRRTERHALLSDKAFTVNWAMKAEPITVTGEFVQQLLRDPTFAKQWSTAVQSCSRESPDAFESDVEEWLFSKGFDISIDDVKATLTQQEAFAHSIYANTYNTHVDGRSGPMLVIRAGSVTWDNTTIKDFTFEGGKLSWSQSDTNQNAVDLDFSMVTISHGLQPDSYIGPYFSGTINTDGAPSRVVGRVGDFPSDFAQRVEQGLNPSHYNETYTTYVKNAQGEWEETNDVLVVNNLGISYLENPLKNATWARNSMLTAFTKDGNPWNISIHFYTIDDSTEDVTPGLHFFGRRWAADASPRGPNFMGVIGQTRNPKKEGDLAFYQLQSIVTAMNVAKSLHSLHVFATVSKLVEKTAAWKRDQTTQTQEVMNEAQSELDSAIAVAKDIELQDTAENPEEDPFDHEPDPSLVVPEPQVADEIVAEELGPFVDVDIVFFGV